MNTHARTKNNKERLQQKPFFKVPRVVNEDMPDIKISIIDKLHPGEYKGSGDSKVSKDVKCTSYRMKEVKGTLRYERCSQYTHKKSYTFLSKKTILIGSIIMQGKTPYRVIEKH